MLINSASMFAELVWCLLVSTSVSGEILDMSWEFKENVTAWWPNDFKPFRVENPFRGEMEAPNGNKIWMEMEEYSASTHGGTHLDAPSHIGDRDMPDLWTLDQIPVHRLIGPLRIINIKAQAARNRDYRATARDVANHEATHGPIPRGAIVLLNSGWSSKLPDREAYWGAGYDEAKLSFPSWSIEAAEFLIHNREIYGVGVDTPSLDYGKSPDFPVHRIFFKANIYGLEHVARVDEAPEKGATLFAFPMKIAGASGGPCRILAIWGDDMTTAFTESGGGRTEL